jgi:rRNA-processing protein FCF1
VDRPAYLEELIPADVRERWGIETRTQMLYDSEEPSLSDCEREIADINTIEIRYAAGSQDARIREKMRHLGIPTVHKMEGNLQRLQKWCVANGKKVRLVQER